MDFKEQFKNPKWQKRRLEILERDKFTCVCCGENKKTLHVHHYRYFKNTNLWEYADEYLTTLCEDCHNEWHKNYNSIKDSCCVDNHRLLIYAAFLEIFKGLSNNKLIKLFKKEYKKNKI